MARLLAKVPTREYDVGDAWVLGRIPGSSDSIQARFLAAGDTAGFEGKFGKL